MQVMLLGTGSVCIWRNQSLQGINQAVFRFFIDEYVKLLEFIAVILQCDTSAPQLAPACFWIMKLAFEAREPYDQNHNAVSLCVFSPHEWESNLILVIAFEFISWSRSIPSS